MEDARKKEEEAKAQEEARKAKAKEEAREAEAKRWGRDVRSCRILDELGTFELFPNGHEHFLSRGALRALNRARRDAIKGGDDTVAPFRDEEVPVKNKRVREEQDAREEGEAGERKHNVQNGVSDVANLTLPAEWTIQDVFGGLAVTSETTAGRGMPWNWRSTRVHEFEGVFGAGAGRAVTFRILSRLKKSKFDEGGLDIYPDSVLYVKLQPKPKGKDDENLVRLLVIDVIWGWKSLVNYIVEGASHVSTGTQQRDGYVMCELIG